MHVPFLLEPWQIGILTPAETIKKDNLVVNLRRLRMNLPPAQRDFLFKFEKTVDSYTVFPVLCHYVHQHIQLGEHLFNHHPYVPSAIRNWLNNALE